MDWLLQGCFPYISSHSVNKVASKVYPASVYYLLLLKLCRQTRRHNLLSSRRFANPLKTATNAHLELNRQAQNFSSSLTPPPSLIVSQNSLLYFNQSLALLQQRLLCTFFVVVKMRSLNLSFQTGSRVVNARVEMNVVSSLHHILHSRPPIPISSDRSFAENKCGEKRLKQSHINVLLCSLGAPSNTTLRILSVKRGEGYPPYP